MSTADAKLVLEGATENEAYEPFQEIIELPVSYVAEPPAQVTGKILLGLQVVEDGDQKIYLIKRLNDDAFRSKVNTSHKEEVKGKLRIGLMKMSWDDLPDIVACYVVGDEKVVSQVPQQEMGLTWQFLLVEDGTELHLIYMEPQGPGPVDKCQAIRQSPVCKNPNSEPCKVKLRIRGCSI